MNIPQFIIGILLIVPGAFMVADGVMMFLGNKQIFFDGVNFKFEFIVGYALIVLGAKAIDFKNGS